MRRSDHRILGDAGIGGEDAADAVDAGPVTGASHEERIDYAVIKEKIRLALKRFIQKRTGRRPMIIPVVVEV